MMAKYSKETQHKVEEVMKEMKEGKLYTGKGHKKVTDAKQAVAIGLSEARAEGEKVPKKKPSTVREKKSKNRLGLEIHKWKIVKCFLVIGKITGQALLVFTHRDAMAY